MLHARVLPPRIAGIATRRSRAVRLVEEAHLADLPIFRGMPSFRSHERLLLDDGILGMPDPAFLRARIDEVARGFRPFAANAGVSSESWSARTTVSASGSAMRSSRTGARPLSRGRGRLRHGERHPRRGFSVRQLAVPFPFVLWILESCLAEVEGQTSPDGVERLIRLLASRWPPEREGGSGGPPRSTALPKGEAHDRRGHRCHTRRWRLRLGTVARARGLPLLRA